MKTWPGHALAKLDPEIVSNIHSQMDELFSAHVNFHQTFDELIATPVPRNKDIVDRSGVVLRELSANRLNLKGIPGDHLDYVEYCFENTITKIKRTVNAR